MATNGVGASLDVNSIVTQLMQVEQRPLTVLATKEAGVQAKISALGGLKATLAQFRDAMQTLISSSFNSSKITSSNADIISASITASSSLTAAEHTLVVNQLAQKQTLSAAGQTSTTTAIGNGVLTFDFGTNGGGSFNSTTGKYTGATFTSNASGTKQITIDSSNNSLAGIRDAINRAQIGVTASIVNDGSNSPYRLVITSNQTGQNQSLKINASGDVALSNLLSQDPAGTQNLSETISAKNANFTLDGIAMTKTSNTVTDALEGISFTLKQVSANPVSLSVAQQSDKITTAVNGFIKAYNDVNTTIKNLTAYDIANKKASIFTGDSSVNLISQKLRGILNSPVTGNNGLTTLAQIGITLQVDGSLKVNNDILQKAINTQANDIAGLFMQRGQTSDALINYVGTSSKTKVGDYAVNVTQLASQGLLSGGAAPNLSITSGVNDTLDLKVDGLSSVITLTAATYNNYAELATALQTQINGNTAFANSGRSVTVTYNGSGLQIQSARFGSASEVLALSGNAKSGLLGTPTVQSGQDIAGTINGAATLGAGRTLTAQAGDAEGIKVEVLGGSTGSRGTVKLSQGYATQLSSLIDGLLSTAGSLSARNDTYQATLKGIDQDRSRLNNRLTMLEKSYRTQFSKLDAALSGMQQQGSIVDQLSQMVSKSSS